MTLQVKQKSSYEGKDWWNWAVWLEGASKELAGVDHVNYTLHSSFPDPVRTIKTRRNGFRLESSGWGEFEIYLEIVRTDGTKSKRAHWLSLEFPDPSAERSVRRTAKKTSRPAAKAKVEAEVARAPAKPKGGGHTVYVSSGAADSEFARKLKEMFSVRGLSVTSIDETAAGQQWVNATRTAIDKSDAAVFVVSGEPNLWSNLEMSYAVAAHPKNIIPVLIGSNARLPASLAKSQAVRVSSTKEINAAMEQILQATSFSKD